MRSLGCIAALLLLVRADSGHLEKRKSCTRSSQSYAVSRRETHKRSSSTCSASNGTRCSVKLAQSDVNLWQAWMQEGLEGCTDTAAQQLNSSATGDPVLIMCHRLGYVTEKQFGAELLVLQIGTPPSNSSVSASTRRTRKRRSSASQLAVQLSYGAGSKSVQAPLQLVSAIQSGDNSTNITSPALVTAIGDLPAQLIGSFHYNHAIPPNANYTDVSTLVPTQVALVGQVAKVLSIDTVLVDLSSPSSQENGFNSTGPWGLFTASSAGRTRLTDDNQCQVSIAGATGATSASAAPQIEEPTSTASDGATVTASIPTPTWTTVTPALTSSTPTSTSASSVVAASSAPLADDAQASTTSVPGQHLTVVPIGIGIVCGIAGVAALIVLFVTYERRKHRKQYREQRLQEQLAAFGEFRGPTDMHIGAPRPMSEYGTQWETHPGLSENFR